MELRGRLKISFLETAGTEARCGLPLGLQFNEGQTVWRSSRLIVKTHNRGLAGSAESGVHSLATQAVKPEDQELARKLSEQTTLEAELTERELRTANLRAEMGAFERRYLHFVGSRYAELDELKAQIAEQFAAEQPDNERAQQAARDARARAGETKSAAGERAETAPRAFEASPEMKRLYRTVAKRIHPDLTSDRDDRVKRQQLMSEANEAYERGDEMQLARILTEYEHSPEAVQGEGPGAELVRVIRRISQMRGRLAEMEAELQELLAVGFVSAEVAAR